MNRYIAKLARVPVEVRRFLGAVALRVNRVRDTNVIQGGDRGLKILISDIRDALHLSERAIVELGAVHAEAIFLAIEALFESGYGTEGADFGRIVELEYELAHLTGLRLKNPGALRTLAALNIGSKTGRAANQLLKQSSTSE